MALMEIILTGHLIKHDQSLCIMSSSYADYFYFKGTDPIGFVKVDGPSGMDVTSETGIVTWEPAVASLKPHVFSVSAFNSYGESTISFEVDVAPSYTVVLDPVPAGPFPRPQPVPLWGTVEFHTPTPLDGSFGVPVVIV